MFCSIILQPISIYDTFFKFLKDGLVIKESSKTYQGGLFFSDNEHVTLKWSLKIPQAVISPKICHHVKDMKGHI